MPCDLLDAVGHAEMILGFQENLLADDQPPAWMWPLPWELEDWFAGLDARRQAGRAGPADDDDQGPMLRNDLAAAMLARRRAG